MDLDLLQRTMRDERLDGWFIYDFRGSNPVLAQILPSSKPRHTTRRVGLFVPAHGEAVLLVSPLDQNQFADAPVAVRPFAGWREWHVALAGLLRGRVAMEYSPGNALPVVSVVDAGLMDMVRSLGVDVVSSANLIQSAIAVWSSEAVRAHRDAAAQVDRVMGGAFDLIRRALSIGGEESERTVQAWIKNEFARAGLESHGEPIVAVNAHAADPHFEVDAHAPAPIRKGDWVLIDMWAKKPGLQHVYVDITWNAYCGPTPPAEQRGVFDAVLAARDASLALAQASWKAKTPVQGWELDDAARGVLIGRGFASGILHRTGHSLSPGESGHGVGMNLDNLETHDTRVMLPGIGFTIEPGLYYPKMGLGIRSELSIHVDPVIGPIPTGVVQRDPVFLA
jgi:Xaa-Pro aminopeptidase